MVGLAATAVILSNGPFIGPSHRKMPTALNIRREKLMLPTAQTVCDILARQFSEASARFAVVCESRRLTFGELDDESGRLALYLLQLGVKVGDIVAIMASRSCDMIIGITGILRAGGAYLPLDPSHPTARNKRILQEARVKILITCEQIRNQVEVAGTASFDCLIIYLDKIEGDSNTTTTLPTLSLSNLAYVLYTSGSTGDPKGVMIQHKSVVNLVSGLHGAILEPYGECLKIALVSPFIFDASVQQIFSALLLGHTLYIAPERARLDGKELIRFYDAHSIDISDGTPTHLKIMSYSNLLDQAHQLSVRHFIIGGEALPPYLVEAFLKRYGAKSGTLGITNVYGVAECAVDSLHYKIDLEEVKTLGFIPIGTPMPNITVQILDEHQHPVNKLDIGEIYIGGMGVGCGYVNSKLDDGKYIVDPSGSNQRVYRTGDLGRLLDDGKIQFIGRADRQIKLRGNRIETSEVEMALIQYSAPIKSQVQSHLTEVLSCQNCLLTSGFPGLSIIDGMCSVCRDFEIYKQHAHNYFKTPSDFVELISHTRSARKGKYDCLLLYSGGKDSTYALYRLIEIGLNVLTFTFDNGFISDTAVSNIKRITSKLDVNHVSISAPNMKQVFRESLRQDSTVCGGCFRGLTYASAQLAERENINVIITGLSRGQILETKLKKLFDNGIYDVREIEERLLLHRKMYHTRRDAIYDLLEISIGQSTLDAMYFVDYFRYDPVTAREIRQYLAAKDGMWQQPQDTGLCSTNCGINDVGIYVHQQERGIHNYASPLSWDCRLGILTREEGLKELKGEIDTNRVRSILDGLGHKIANDGHPTIQNVAVTLQEAPSGEPILCAHYVSAEEIPASKLRDHLIRLLPAYMIPSKFVHMARLPLNSSGKLDVRQLPNPYSRNKGVGTSAGPAESAEDSVLTAWLEVLGVESVDVDDNFFELGGDSLSAVTLTMLLERAVGVELSLMDLFKMPTVRHMTSHIEAVQLSDSRKSAPGVLLLRRASRNAKNLFLFHDSSGGIEGYLKLCEHLDCHTWGVLRDDVAEESNLQLSLEQLCDISKNKLKLVQSQGPYYLCGWSLGGVIAYEVSRQLEIEGSQVKLLTLIDSSVPAIKRWQRLYHDSLRLLRHLAAQYDSSQDKTRPITTVPPRPLEDVVNDILLNKIGIAEIRRYLLPEIKDIIPTNIESPQGLLSRLKRVLFYINMLSRYQPHNLIDAPMIVFEACQASVEASGDWSQFCKSRLLHIQMKASHFSIITAPHVIEIANSINKFIA